MKIINYIYVFAFLFTTLNALEANAQGFGIVDMNGKRIHVPIAPDRPKVNEEFQLHGGVMKGKQVNPAAKSVGSIMCNLGQNNNSKGSPTGFSVTYINETEQNVIVRYNGPFKSRKSTEVDSDNCSKKFYMIKKKEFYYNWAKKDVVAKGSVGTATEVGYQDPEIKAAVSMIESYNLTVSLLYRASDLCFADPSYEHCKAEKNPAVKSEKTPDPEIKKGILQRVKEFFSPSNSESAQ